MTTRDHLKRIRELLDDADMRQLRAMLVTILAMGILETIGIASILPFMTLVADPGMIERSGWLKELYLFIGFESSREMLIWSGIAVMVLFTASLSFGAFTSWFIQKSIWSIAHRLSMRMVHRYTELPYEFFLTHDSSELLKKLISDVTRFVSGILTAGSQFTVYTTLSLMIFCMLLVAEPFVALSAFGVFSGTYVLLHRVLHGYINDLGKQRMEMSYQRFRTFTDVIGGLKAIKTYGVSRYFTTRFEDASAGLSKLHPKYHLVVVLPRYAIEFLAFGTILLTIIFWLSSGDAFAERLPLLTLFALAAYRLLPALNKAYDSAAQISHNLPVIEEVHKDLVQEAPHEIIDHDEVQQTLPFTRALTIRELRFAYQSSETDVLRDIDITIDKGSKVALVGSTGSGKSTLMDILVGLLIPSPGSFTIDDEPLTHKNVAAWRRHIAYVPQDGFLYDADIAGNIAFGVEPDRIDMARIRYASRVAQIADFIENDLPDGYATQAGERGVRLSGGQRQRIALARAIYRGPSVLLLDEATSALDAVTEEAVVEALHDGFPDLTMVMIAHRLSTVRHCERILVIERGRIVGHGSYDELRASNAVFRQMVEAANRERDAVADQGDNPGA